MAHVSTRTANDGTRYYVARWRTPDGAFRQKRFAAKKDAADYAKAQDTDVARGVYVDERLRRKTFRTVAQEWLDSKTTVKPHTLAKYERILTARINPRFGSREVASLKRTDGAAFIKALAAEGLSSASIQRIFGQYRSIMLYAIDEGYVSTRNVIKVKVPTDHNLGRDIFTPRFLTVAELDRLADDCALFHPDYGLLIRFLALTGLRVGEASALTVGDVITYLDGRMEVTVSKSASGTTKTRASVRAVTLPPSLATDVTAYLRRHPASTPDAAPPATAPLWCGRVTGGQYWSDWMDAPSVSKHHAPAPGYRPLCPDTAWDPGVFAKRIWRRAVTLSGLSPLRLHDLRHTAASLMLASGMHMLEVSKALGHADPAITASIYAHLLPTEIIRSSHRYDDWLAAEREAAPAPPTPLRLARN